MLLLLSAVYCSRGALPAAVPDVGGGGSEAGADAAAAVSARDEAVAARFGPGAPSADPRARRLGSVSTDLTSAAAASVAAAVAQEEAGVVGGVEGADSGAAPSLARGVGRKAPCRSARAMCRCIVVGDGWLSTQSAVGCGSGGGESEPVERSGAQCCT